MKILITGSGGFIGSNLAEHLAKENEIFAPRSFELDLADARATERFFGEREFGAIVHCATVGGVRGVIDPADAEEKNFAMFENIARNARGGAKIIAFGSGAQYDKSRPLVKVPESALGERVPADAYGRSKLRIARAVEEIENAVCLNIFGCFGKNEKDWRFPTYALRCCLNGEKIEINRDVRFDYLWAGDLCRAVEFFIRNKTSERVFNITPTQSATLSQLAGAAKEATCADVDIAVKSEGLGNEYTGDNSRFLSAARGFEFTPLKTALGRFAKILKNAEAAK